MSFADSINGFKKTYATEYRDNNKCPYDETVESSKEQSTDLIKFPKYENEVILNYASASYTSVGRKDFDDDDDYKTTVSFDEDENEFKDNETFYIDDIEKDDEQEHFGYDT